MSTIDQAGRTAYLDVPTRACRPHPGMILTHTGTLDLSALGRSRTNVIPHENEDSPGACYSEGSVTRSPESVHRGWGDTIPPELGMPRGCHLRGGALPLSHVPSQAETFVSLNYCSSNEQTTQLNRGLDKNRDTDNA